MANLLALPNEIILQILENLPVRSLRDCALSCQLLHLITNAGSLWQKRCLADFVYWDKSHNIGNLQRQPLNAVDWKALYLARLDASRKAQHGLNSILTRQAGRIDTVHELLPLGDDVKDVLHQNIAVPDSSSDVLARRWYARAILSRLQREEAIRTWSLLALQEPVPLVQALHAFDVFVLQEKALSYDAVTSILDQIAQAVRNQWDTWDQFSTRTKATKIAAYLLEEQLIGLKPGHRYMDVRNSFIGHALSHDEHPSIPLISTVIFCVLAERLGVDAKPCGFPGHVLAIVFPQQGNDLDGNPVAREEADNPGYDQRMYLDPFQSASEKPVAELFSTLRSLRINGGDVESAMNPSSDAEILQRCGRNIISAVHQGLPQARGADSVEIDSQSALYASLWCFLILSGLETGDDVQGTLARRRMFLPHLVERFEQDHPFDAKLLLEIVCPMFDTTSERIILRNHIRDAVGNYTLPPQPKRRSEVRAESVKYRIGQLFRHRKYGYQGLIYGWDIECAAAEEWIQRMRVLELRRGRQQSFYHIICDDSTSRYVAEDNIDIVQAEEPSPIILSLAGKYFKRWDESSSSFISNIRDEYPDD